MDKKTILETINSIFIEVLENRSIVLTPETTAGDVAEWDSLTHIQLVVAIEKKFGVRFTSREIQSWKNVGQLVDTLSTKLG
ncbi:MAG TPA: acyl carrier protein [Puia sp.]|jgi:acyl carrier protein|nr:acyl carrier protein [Puia sp.]